MVARLPENYPHLGLVRADVQLDRRRRGVGPAPNRDSTQHGLRIAQGVEDVLRQFQLPRLPEAVDPALIFKVRLEGNIEDDDWRRNELVVLAREPARNLVLFSTDSQLTEFRNRLSAYQAGVQPGRRNPAYNGLFNAILEIVPLEPADRLGHQLAGIGIEANTTYSVDVELWPLGNANQRQSRAQQVENYVRQQGGEVLDRVINESMVILRVRARGAILEQLLRFEVVAILDLPPQPTLPVADVLSVTLQDLPPIAAPPDGASVCVVDSGVARGHPLLGPAIGDTDAFPASIGTPDDGHGHGSMVAGIAVYNDIETCIQNRSFAPQVRLFSSRVTNDQNRFDDNTLIMTQMREAITRFAIEGCRVFNVSLGDESRIFSDGRLSPWAAILDTLARELNVIIVVSAGNRSDIPDDPPGRR